GAPPPPEGADGTPRLTVAGEAGAPGCRAGRGALPLSTLGRGAVPPLYPGAPRDPRLLDYLPAWFNHGDTRVNPEALARVLGWLDRWVEKTAWSGVRSGGYG